MTTFSETSLPALIFTLPAGHPKGSAEALGRLTVSDTQAVNQSWLVWGVEQDDKYAFTDSSGSGALFYEAESRTLLSGSSIVTLSGSSGGGTNNAIVSAGLPTSFVPILSTQASGGGAHLTHAGSFKVLARVQSTAAGTGSIQVALDWAYGDFLSFSRNAVVTLTSDKAGSFQLIDLGIVSIPRPATGSQRWQGRIVALSTAGGDTLNVDCLLLVPVGIASGEATAAPPSASSMELSIYDPFNQTAGALAGKVTGIGSATWTFQTGDTDDWNVDATNHIITRTPISDTARRLMTAGTANFTALTAQVDIEHSALSSSILTGLLLRHVDANNFLLVYPFPANNGTAVIQIHRRVGGGEGDVATSSSQPFAINTRYTLQVSLDTAGNIVVYWYPAGGSPGSAVLTASYAPLATAGAIASGKVGITDHNQGTVVCTRTMDNFLVQAPSGGTSDAVIFASQSAEVRSDTVIREDSTGTFWQPVASYEGDYLQIPPTGREQRQTRFIVKASRNAPGLGPDSAIDDISATFAYTPRYLSVPVP